MQSKLWRSASIMYWTFPVLIKKAEGDLDLLKEYSHAMTPTKKLNNVFINLELYVYLGLIEVCA